MDRNELNAVASSLGLLLSENETIYNNDDNNIASNDIALNNNNNEEEADHNSSSNNNNNQMESEDGLNAMVIYIILIINMILNLSIYFYR